jgi:hypothetical protein
VLRIHDYDLRGFVHWSMLLPSDEAAMPHAIAVRARHAG